MYIATLRLGGPVNLRSSIYHLSVSAASSHETCLSTPQAHEARQEPEPRMRVACMELSFSQDHRIWTRLVVTAGVRYTEQMVGMQDSVEIGRRWLGWLRRDLSMSATRSISQKTLMGDPAPRSVREPSFLPHCLSMLLYAGRCDQCYLLPSSETTPTYN